MSNASARWRAAFRVRLEPISGTKKFAVLGLTFKPNTDDMRAAPSIALITALQDMGAHVKAFDPVGMKQAAQILSGVDYCENAYACAQDADAIVIVTEWEQFRALDIGKLQQLMRSAIMIDLRNVYRAEEIVRKGFAYYCIGKGDPSLAATWRPPSDFQTRPDI